jgi:hypothetical protein
MIFYGFLQESAQRLSLLKILTFNQASGTILIFTTMSLVYTQTPKKIYKPAIGSSGKPVVRPVGILVSSTAGSAGEGAERDRELTAGLLVAAVGMESPAGSLCGGAGRQC